MQMCKDQGRELTEDQKAMIAEIEADEELLDQTGRIDYLNHRDAFFKKKAMDPDVVNFCIHTSKQNFKKKFELRPIIFGLTVIIKTPQNDLPSEVKDRIKYMK